MYPNPQGKPLLRDIPPLNPAVKWIVNNYCFIGYPSTFFAQHIPTIVVNRALVDLINSCPQNTSYMRYSVMADALEDAIQFARRAAGTSNILCFDGASGGFNLTPSLADLLQSKVPYVEEEVEGHLLPKWCQQRGLQLEGRG